MEFFKLKEKETFLEIGVIDISILSSGVYSSWQERISKSRKEQVNLYRYEIDRKRCVCGEIIIKELYSLFSSEKAMDVELKKNDKGKPYLCNSDYSISLSHSGDFVVGIISENEVGIDIEKQSDLEWSVARHFLPYDDLIYIQGDEGVDVMLTQKQKERFFEVWTTKEAYAKLCGTGLSKQIFNIPHKMIDSKVIYYNDYIISYVYDTRRGEL